MRLDKHGQPLKYDDLSFATAELQGISHPQRMAKAARFSSSYCFMTSHDTRTSLPCFSALWEGVQQDAQPNGPHASPLRQQTLQMPLLPEQVHAEGKPHQTHEGQTRCHGQRAG